LQAVAVHISDTQVIGEMFADPVDLSDLPPADPGPRPCERDAHDVWAADYDRDHAVWLCLPPGFSRGEVNAERHLFRGRVMRPGPVALDPSWDAVMMPGEAGLVVNVSASRLTGASIAGLVVGAMGVFVFAGALRHWLGERGRIAGELNAA